MVRIALAGDTMLGRGVADRLSAVRPPALFDDAVVAFGRRADLFILNLECCISDGGDPWPDPGKPFFFRAPPAAVEVLVHLGVDCVTLANNHALDFGTDALLDTLARLEAAGIRAVGAGPDLAAARRPAVLDRDGTTVAVIGASDHPADFAAAGDRPGIAYADLPTGVPPWLLRAVAGSGADVTLVTPHWGPNMNPAPLPYVRRAAGSLAEAGATLVAGHSAHVFQGVEGPLLYDLGDFIDDYAVDPVLRNDLGLLWVVTIEGGRAVRLEVLPLALDFCYTRPATGDDRAWIGRRFHEACRALGTEVRAEDGILAVSLG